MKAAANFLKDYRETEQRRSTVMRDDEQPL